MADVALALAGLAMGVAASPHCAAMCGAPCAALSRGCKRNAAGFHAGRLLSYTAGGAVAAGSVATLSAWSQAVPALRPLWLLMHLGILALGLWWLFSGRQLDWMKRHAVVRLHIASGKKRPLRTGLVGLAWVAWPCGALQAALMLAALASSAQGGALVMFGFAAGSIPALAVAPWLWSRWQAWNGRAISSARAQALSFRTAGAGLVLAAGWALTHGMWRQIAAWCAT